VNPPFALGDTPERAARDGCGCPEWVIRCAHFGGQSLHFVDSTLFNNPKNHRAATDRYQVTHWVDATARPHCEKCGAWVGPRSRLFPQVGTEDYAAALAAFHEAEERLLRGDS